MQRQRQGFRLLLSALRRSSLTTKGRCFSSSSSSALPHYSDHLSPDDDLVLVNGRSNSRMALLNRPSSLNSLNTPMVVFYLSLPSSPQNHQPTIPFSFLFLSYNFFLSKVSRLKRLYESWEDNSNIGFVLMKGKDNAFCSGADVVSLYHSIVEGNMEGCREFFDTLYKFVYLQATYLKPHVAILDGITMGSGAGISLPGMFRLATDKTVFAHPEVQIGFYPDAGASFYLSRLPGYLGEYLALTGDKLNGVEMVACGLATHYSLNARLPLMDERLSKLITDEPSVMDTSLAQYGDVVFPDSGSILHRINAIDNFFGHDTVEEIVHALETEVSESHDNWCVKTLMKIREASPLSLKVTLRSVREGRFQSLDQCLGREFQISLRGTCGSVSKDFREGVRARLVDRDFAPKWDPPTLAEATEEMVEQYFLPAEETEPVLELPIASREPFV